ncbi:polyketide synthase dehydratase domain-containing protein, partial [Candidatus Poseidoniaceae archaeon]|nr:polyketide synthase dehydratase domain-containing protein [Candidatus Poseidoniaceae archaeon]
ALPIDDEFVLSDYPTLNHMIEYINKMTGGAATVVAAPVVAAIEVVEQPQPTVQTIKPQSSDKLVDLSTSEITPVVVEVVVAHTGYPADFIELDQDLEGELGIDTVKQAEIMADIREKFSLPIDDDFVLSDYPTLNHMIAYIAKMTGGEVVTQAPIIVATPQPVEEIVEDKPIPVPSSVGSANIEEKLVEVVVSHTGYPADFIEMDQDLEGELGIDTVKQAEIMGEIRDIFALPVDDDFVLSDHPTLNHFSAYIAKMVGGDSVDEPVVSNTQSQLPKVEEITIEKPSNDVVSTTRRWQIEIEECLGTSQPISLDGTVVITVDGWGISEAFAQRMEQRGLKTVLVGFESAIRDMSTQEESGRIVYRCDPENSQHLEDVCEQLNQHNVTAVIHMASLKLASESWSDDSYPSSQIAMSAHGFFSLLKGLDSKLAGQSSGLVASISAMDGRHGNRGERFNSLQSAATGVTKSYSFEQPHLRCRAFDLHPELILQAQQAAQIIDEDLFELGGDVEIGIDRDLRRWTLVAFAEDLESQREPLTNEDTWIVSGGGSGVTAASVIGVSKASPDAGAHFVLLGRSNLIEECQSWINWTEQQLNDEKMALRQTMTDANEEGKVTMVEWNKEWQKYTRSLDIYNTIQQIADTGNSAQYCSVNVTDAEGLAELGANLGRKITGILHGAGLEDSKLVADKSNEIFNNVVRVKVDGWRALLGAVHASGSENPRFACCFTSVAGRFGNGGQTDYAAANCVLDSEMTRLTASGTCRAVAIGWTGWRDVGMATRGSIEAVFEAAGIETLSVEEGVSIFVDEALSGGKRRVIGCGSLGIMNRFDIFRDAPLRLPAKMAALIADPARFPFIDKVNKIDEDQSLTTQSTLSAADHPFLIDHAIEGVPYHPGVMALEMFAQNALLLRPQTCLAGFEDVQFGLPVKLLKGEMTVRVESTLDKQDGQLSWVKCRLVSDLTNSKGEVFGEREHHQATVRLVEKCDDICPFLEAEVGMIPAIGTPPMGELLHTSAFIYLRYFHGPRFQSHGGIIRGVGDDSMPGVDGIALMRHQLPQSDQWAVESQGELILLEALPMLIEAGFQNAGLVAMESENFSSLPVGIEWTCNLRVPEKDEVLRLRSIRTAVEDAGITVHDVVIVGDDDAPVLALKGLRLKAMAPVPEYQQFTLPR